MGGVGGVGGLEYDIIINSSLFSLKYSGKKKKTTLYIYIFNR